MIDTNKIIFLDFDGVITAINDGSSYLCYKPECYKPSERCVSFLKEFIKETDSKIIISSNWRRYKPDQCFEYKGQKYYNFMNKVIEIFGDAIIGCIPIDRGLKKYEAIHLWFEDTDFKGNYVIFDDQGSYEGFYADPKLSKHFIETDPTYGLSKNDLEKAKEILNGNL